MIGSVVVTAYRVSAYTAARRHLRLSSFVLRPAAPCGCCSHDAGSACDCSALRPSSCTQAVEGSAKKSKKRPAEENGGPITPDGEESPSPAKKQKGSKKQKVRGRGPTARDRAATHVWSA